MIDVSLTLLSCKSSAGTFAKSVFYTVALFFEQIGDFFPQFALNDDFPVFGGTAHAAFVFQVAGEGF